MAMGDKKYADAVVARFSKGPTAPADDDEAEDAEGGDEGSAADDAEAKAQGAVLRNALAKKDDLAIREAVKAIVHECLEEYGIGK